MTLIISQKGWVVIPSDLRKKYKLHPGRMVQIVDYGGVLTLVPSLEDPLAQSMGMMKGKGQSLRQALLEEHRQEIENE